MVGNDDRRFGVLRSYSLPSPLPPPSLPHEEIKPLFGITDFEWFCVRYLSCVETCFDHVEKSIKYLWDIRKYSLLPIFLAKRWSGREDEAPGGLCERGGPSYNTEGGVFWAIRRADLIWVRWEMNSIVRVDEGEDDSNPTQSRRISLKNLFLPRGNRRNFVRSIYKTQCNFFVISPFHWEKDLFFFILQCDALRCDMVR